MLLDLISIQRWNPWMESAAGSARRGENCGSGRLSPACISPQAPELHFAGAPEVATHNMSEDDRVLSHAQYWDGRYAESSGSAQPTHEWIRSFAELEPFLEANLSQGPASVRTTIHLSYILAPETAYVSLLLVAGRGRSASSFATSALNGKDDSITGML